MVYPDNVGYTHGTRCGLIDSKELRDYYNSKAAAQDPFLAVHGAWPAVAGQARDLRVAATGSPSAPRV